MKCGLHFTGHDIASKDPFYETGNVTPYTHER